MLVVWMRGILGSGCRVLVVDDEQPVRELLARFLDSQGFQAAQAATAEEALALLEREPVEVVLSDVQMPGMNGLSLLSEIRRRYPDVAVLMLTACEDVSMAVDAMKAGALDYVTKPFELEKVARAVSEASQRHRALRNEEGRLHDLERTVQEQTAQLRALLGDLDEASEGTLDALVAALDAREHETQAHSHRVAEYTVRLASEMGLRRSEIETIRQGAMLHDIGKIGISDNILLKPGQLTEAEWREMRRHPQIGYWILNGIERLRPAAGIVLSHHERFDGTGYPRGLKAEQIPLGARIFSVADSLDAITSDRPYKYRKSYDAAREEIRKNAGLQFDPGVVHCFLRIPSIEWTDIRARTLSDSFRTFSDLPQLVLE